MPTRLCGRRRRRGTAQRSGQPHVRAWCVQEEMATVRERVHARTRALHGVQLAADVGELVLEADEELEHHVELGVPRRDRHLPWTPSEHTKLSEVR